jgi:hypothetical protein
MTTSAIIRSMDMRMDVRTETSSSTSGSVYVPGVGLSGGVFAAVGNAAASMATAGSKTRKVEPTSTVLSTCS